MAKNMFQAKESTQGGKSHISTMFEENNPCAALNISISCKAGKVVSELDNSAHEESIFGDEEREVFINQRSHILL